MKTNQIQVLQSSEYGMVISCISEMGEFVSFHYEGASLAFHGWGYTVTMIAVSKSNASSQLFENHLFFKGIFSGPMSHNYKYNSLSMSWAQECL